MGPTAPPAPVAGLGVHKEEGYSQTPKDLGRRKGENSSTLPTTKESTKKQKKFLTATLWKPKFNRTTNTPVLET